MKEIVLMSWIFAAIILTLVFIGPKVQKIWRSFFTVMVLLTIQSCQKEEPYTPGFCQCHQEHEMTLNGSDWYPYPAANTEPQDGFCDEQTPEYFYQSTDHRFRVICQ